MLKSELIKLTNSIGITKIGVTRDENNTVIAALFPHFAADEDGNIAMHARGRDYHRVAAEKLEVLCEFLRERGAGSREIYVDNIKRDDRQAAYNAGLGFWGRNNLLICDELGTYFVIGQIVTDIYIEPDEAQTRGCADCGECVKACPSGALADFSKEKCVTYMLQSKHELNGEQLAAIKKSGSVWGCDVCQKVCPHNAGLETTALPEFLQNRILFLKAEDFEGISSGEFAEKYKDYSFVWRGAEVLKRNVKLQS